jgi:hypothetical protein
LDTIFTRFLGLLSAPGSTVSEAFSSVLPGPQLEAIIGHISCPFRFKEDAEELFIIFMAPVSPLLHLLRSFGTRADDGVVTDDFGRGENFGRQNDLGRGALRRKPAVFKI